jgi:endonuclease/exonuclease/phosphatase (EEP) superfamily protein YafD
MTAWSRVVLNVLGTVYLAGLVAGVGVTSLGSAQTGWPALLQELAPLLFVPVLPLLGLALFLRARGLIIGLLAACALFAWLYGPSLSPHAAPATRGPAFRVLTLNVGAARRLDRPDAVVRAVRATAPDVVCLVEARADALKTIGLPLRDVYPYQAASETVFVLSRFPLSDSRTRVLRTGAHDSLKVTAEVDHHLIGLTAVHLRRADAYPGLKQGGASLLRAAQGFSTEERDAAVGELARLLHDEGGAQVLVGDFNMTPTSHSHRVLTSVLEDAFGQVGWVGHTYPTTLRSLSVPITLPLIRIDYIFHTRDLLVQRAWVGPNSGSDHLPVIADLVLR